MPADNPYSDKSGLIEPDYSGDIIKTINTQTLEEGDVPIRGWDNTRQVIPDFTNNNIFLGVPNVVQDTLPFIEPFIGGYGRVWCLQAPIFFAPKLRGLMQRMFERMCKGLSGISNYELQTTDIVYGNNAETYTVPTGIKKGNNSFSLRFTEVQGGLFRKIHKYWGTGISDLGSGYGTYHGKTWTNNLRFSAANHSSIFLYALTDNSGGAYGLDSIEFACIWFGAFPTQIPNSHFEWTQGEHNTMDLDIPYFGIFHENNTVNSIAAEILTRSNFYADNYNDFDVGPSVWRAVNNRSDNIDDTNPVVAGIEPFQGAIEGTPQATKYASLIDSDAGMAPLSNTGGE
jgi:hypothetical protein